jgi:hypothetical protein
MKNISTGTGLAIVAAAALAYPFVSSFAPNANASVVAAAASAVGSVAMAQAMPTIVWYGITHNDRFAYTSNGCNFGGCDRSFEYSVLARAWSDGKVEIRKICTGDNCSSVVSASDWFVVNAPSEGLTYRSDINFDSKVDGADLSQVLNDWGNAPRQDIPPSTCPLNLINP